MLQQGEDFVLHIAGNVEQSGRKQDWVKPTELSSVREWTAVQKATSHNAYSAFTLFPYHIWLMGQFCT